MARSKLAFFLAGLLTTVGCDPKPGNSSTTSEKTSRVTLDDVRHDSAAALETTAAYSNQNKEKLMKDLKDQLAIMDANIEQLRLKGQKLTNDAKEDWAAKMSELDIRRETVHAKLTEIETSTAEAWSDVERGAISAWEELKKAFQNASKEF